jgi:hypothetical protein
MTKKRSYKEVHDAFLFSAPRFTGPRRHALLVLMTGLFEHRSTFPRPGERARQTSASNSPKCLTLVLGRLAKCSHGVSQMILMLIFTPNPAHSRSGPTPCTRASARRRWVQVIFWGTCLGLRERPAGRSRCTACAQRLRVHMRECRVFEAAGRVCAGERTWP